jgi:hypothetical protein
LNRSNRTGKHGGSGKAAEDVMKIKDIMSAPAVVVSSKSDGLAAG